MLFGYICAASPGGFVKGKMNSSKYSELLKKKLPQSARELWLRVKCISLPNMNLKYKAKATHNKKQC